MEIDDFLDQELGVKERAEPSIEDLPEEVREAMKAKSAEVLEEKGAEKKPEIKKEAEAKIEGDIDRLIGRANSLISKGDFEGARQVYLKIKEMKKELPKKFIKEEEKVSKSLLALNESLIHGMDKTLSTDFNEKFSRINKLLDDSYSCMRESKITRIEDLAKIDEIYKRIKQLYAALPEGFMEKKVMVQDQMLKLYKIIITSKKNLLSDDFRKKSQEIIRLMKGVADEISRSNFENASKLFSRTTQLYKELPKGFLREKTELQSRILDIYQKLVMGRESLSYSEFDRKSAETRELFKKAYSFVKRDKLKEASKEYNNMAVLYSKLPPGYYSRKADLEIEMMELHHMISLKKDKWLLEETKAKINEIDTLLESSKNYMINKEYDLAKEVYDEIVDVYNSLPEGFFEQNVKTQNKIIKLYKDLLAYMHEPLVAETTKVEKGKYGELLKLLVGIHRHIKKKEFREIKRKYLLAYKLYHELPLSIIEEKKHLYKEIYRIYEELRLYTSLDRLAEHVERNEYDKLAALLDRAAEEYNLLSKKYPQDIELFKYIQAKCLVYLEMLKRKKAGKAEAKKETGADVKKKIESVVSIKKGLEGELPVQTEVPGKAEEKAAGTDKAKGYLEKKYGVKK